MKKVFTLLCGALIAFGSFSQVNVNAPWAWMSGDKFIVQRPVTGTKGIPAPANTPGGRKDATTWVTPDGSVWLFGGFGYAGNDRGYLNDLWRYDAASNQWTWVNGENKVDQAGNYGSQGVSSPSTIPPARRGSISWLDASGNLILFGGEFNSNRFNDVWKYNLSANEWTWVAGSSNVNSEGVYGTLGSPSPSNWPGARNGATCWKDGNTIWLFGGHGYAAGNIPGSLNDLWKYDVLTNEWTWVSGSNNIDAFTTISQPGARNSGANGWKDAAGDLYLFGGIAGQINGPTSTNPFGTYLNELWKYSTSLNTWSLLKGGSLTGTGAVYGTQGIFSAANQPGRRAYSISWTDNSGNFWMFGGRGYSSDAFTYLSDIWQYNPVTNQWAWMKGFSAGENFEGTHGQQGVANPTNQHDGRSSGTAWVDASGKLWSFGGDRFTGAVFSLHNDVWQYDPSSNLHTWIKGDSSVTNEPLYGVQGTAGNLNKPGERIGAGTWTDNSGNLWLYGGDILNTTSGPPAKCLNDLWKYNITTGEWTWMKGGPGFSNGVYGSLGVPHEDNRPGDREEMKCWSDASNNFWMFGGFGFLGNYNDLWRYNPSTNQWTWVKGSNSSSYQFNSDAVYGIQGTPDINNRPGRRRAGAAWTDNAGNFWTFGGSGRNGNYINDLWKYDPLNNTWTWMHGEDEENQPGSYGSPGVASAGNTPGARDGAVAWKDTDGNLWLFGGELGNTSGNPYEYFNDVWKYDIFLNQWTWITGDNTSNNAGVYGVAGTPDATNKPGGRTRATAWTDAEGNFWLFGGRGFDASGNFGELNDLWMFSITTKQWVWVRGDNTVAVNGVYGTKGTPSLNGKPGSRYGAAGWRDAAGDFWLYGGTGLAENGRDRLSDMWRITSVLLSPLPLGFVDFKGKLVNNDGFLNWITENEENVVEFIVERSVNGSNYEAVGTVAANNTSGRQHYQYTDDNIRALGVPVVYYRLKQTDTDGKISFSTIVALTMDKSALIMFYPNPTSSTANVTVTIDRREVVNARIISQSGAIVKQVRWSLDSGSTTLNMDVSTLAKGVYYFDVKGETVAEIIRFIKE